MRLVNRATNYGLDYIDNQQKAMFSQKNAIRKDDNDVTKVIQKQITSVQEQMKSVMDNKGLSDEEKVAKKKELETQLQSLSKQLVQVQIDQQKQETEKKAKEVKDNAEKQAGIFSTDIKEGNSASLLDVIVGASNDMKEAQKVNAIKADYKGHAGVLDAEIKQEKAKMKDASSKEAELAEVNSAIDSLNGKIITKLADLNKDMNNQEISVDGKDNQDVSVDKKDKDKNDQSQDEVSKADENTDENKSDKKSYTPIDIRV